MSRSRQSPELGDRALTVLGYLGRRGCRAPAGRAAGAQPGSPQQIEEGGQRLRHGPDSAAGRRCSGLAGSGQPSGLTAPRPFPAGSAPRPPLGVPPRAPAAPRETTSQAGRRALTIVTAAGSPTPLGFPSELPAWVPAPRRPSRDRRPPAARDHSFSSSPPHCSPAPLEAPPISKAVSRRGFSAPPFG